MYFVLNFLIIGFPQKLKGHNNCCDSLLLPGGRSSRFSKWHMAWRLAQSG